MGNLRYKQVKHKKPSFLGFLKEGRQGLRFLLWGLCWALLLSIPTVGLRWEGSSLGFVISNLGIVGKLFQMLGVSISTSVQGECQ